MSRFQNTAFDEINEHTTHHYNTWQTIRDEYERDLTSANGAVWESYKTDAPTSARLVEHVTFKPVLEGGRQAHGNLLQIAHEITRIAGGLLRFFPPPEDMERGKTNLFDPEQLMRRSTDPMFGLSEFRRDLLALTLVQRDVIGFAFDKANPGTTHQRIELVDYAFKQMRQYMDAAKGNKRDMLQTFLEQTVATEGAVGVQWALLALDPVAEIVPTPQEWLPVPTITTSLAPREPARIRYRATPQPTQATLHRRQGDPFPAGASAPAIVPALAFASSTTHVPVETPLEQPIRAWKATTTAWSLARDGYLTLHARALREADEQFGHDNSTPKTQYLSRQLILSNEMKEVVDLNERLLDDTIALAEAAAQALHIDLQKTRSFYGGAAQGLYFPSLTLPEPSAGEPSNPRRDFLVQTTDFFNSISHIISQPRAIAGKQASIRLKIEGIGRNLTQYQGQVEHFSRSAASGEYALEKTAPVPYIDLSKSAGSVGALPQAVEPDLKDAWLAWRRKLEQWQAVASSMTDSGNWASCFEGASRQLMAAAAFMSVCLAVRNRGVIVNLDGSARDPGASGKMEALFITAPDREVPAAEARLFHRSVSFYNQFSSLLGSGMERDRLAEVSGRLCGDFDAEMATSLAEIGPQDVPTSGASRALLMPAGTVHPLSSADRREVEVIRTIRAK